MDSYDVARGRCTCAWSGPDGGHATLCAARQPAEDPREAQYSAERVELEAAVFKAVQGQYIGKPPPLLTGWAERAVSAVVSAGWLPPAAVAERVHTAREDAYHRGWQSRGRSEN